METPFNLYDPIQVTDDIHVIPSSLALPSLGLLPINSFLIRAKEPVLVDTGPGPIADGVLEKVGELIDLNDLRWIWMTHADPDHTGALHKVLAAAPRARVAIAFLGAGKLSLTDPLPEDRVRLIEPGARIPLGDRELVAVRPPVYDAPETLAAFDPKSRVFFSADSFGGLLPEMTPSAADLPEKVLDEGMVAWAGIDAPWLENVPGDRLKKTLERIRRLDPSMVLSAHLPPAPDMLDRLSANLEAARKAAEPTNAAEAADWFQGAVI